MRSAWNLTTSCLPVDWATARRLRQLVWTAVDGPQTWRGDPPRPDFAPRIYTSRDEVQLDSWPHADVETLTAVCRGFVKPLHFHRSTADVSYRCEFVQVETRDISKSKTSYERYIVEVVEERSQLLWVDRRARRHNMQALGITLPAVRGQSGAHGLAVRWLAERSGRGRERQGARAGATSDQPTYRRPSAAHSLTARTRHTAMSAASTAQQPRRQRRGGTSQPRRHQASTTSHKVRNASAATELFNCRYDLIHSTREVVKNRFSCQQIKNNNLLL